MADAKETKVDKRKGPRGPRTPKPIFCVVTVRDAQGNELNMGAQSGHQIEVRMTKDSAELVQILTSGNASNSAVVQATQSEAPARANPGDAA